MYKPQLPKANLGKIIKLGVKVVKVAKASPKVTTTASKGAKKLAPIINFKTAMGTAKPAKLVTTAQRDIKLAQLAKKLDQAKAAAKPVSKITKAKAIAKKGTEKMASGVRSISDKVVSGLLIGLGSGTGTYFASKALDKDNSKTKTKSKTKSK